MGAVVVCKHKTGNVTSRYLPAVGRGRPIELISSGRILYDGTYHTIDQWSSALGAGRGWNSVTYMNKDLVRPMATPASINNSDPQGLLLLLVQFHGLWLEQNRKRTKKKKLRKK